MMPQSVEYPLTHAQESLYFLQQLTRDEPVYNMPQAFRLRGALDITALKSALRHVVGRHEALRLIIKETTLGPRQISSLDAPDLRLHATTRERLPSDLTTSARQKFDLGSGPIFRVDLFEVETNEHVLLLNLHHVAGDMASLGILFEELSVAYEACKNGRTPELEAPTVQLGSYAAQRRAREISAKTLQFWRENLQGCTGGLDLPLDRFRPRYPTFRGGASYFELPGELRAGLNNLARKNRSSLYMVFLAALQALLHRYTGQEKFSLATPFTDREDPALEKTVGYLVNLLPIACEVDRQKTFRDLLGEVRAQCLTVYAHHEISFREILQQLGISSDSPKPPLAQVVFQYFPEIASLRLAGLEVEPIQVHSQTSKFDLCISLWESAGKITAEIEYDSDIYNESTISRFAEHYQNLLQAVTREPDTRVGDIQISGESEQRIISEWSSPVTSYPRDKAVHALFEEQVERTPDRAALLFQDQEVSYRRLNDRANQVAAQLRATGVQAGDFVGVCLERSPDLIAALIGILKTGAAYVPFEASYPKARLDYLFADSAVRVLITDSARRHIAPGEITIIDIETPSQPLGEKQSSASDAESVAYVMYTSGSTGHPKGAMIPHRAIVRLVKNNDFASFDSSQIFLAFAPVSFDASTLEIWGPLLNGGTLVIYPPQFDSVEQFEEVLQRHGVSTLWLTAGLFNTIVDRKVTALRGIRQLLIGGDVLSVAHVRKALASLPGTEIINGYGPTENTTFTCCFRIPADFGPDRSVPIGRPIKNTSVYILDEHLQPAPIGVPGELYAGGDGLALGYWNKPDLTEKSFLPNPFEPHGRLYRTGDRARFLADGNIEFLGRRDSQVKIRGFRIEIEEVEAAFRKVDAVRDVAVVAHPDNAGGKSLVAYVVMREGSKPNLASLQAEVGNALPTHACPSRVIFLPELPLGPNGKVNRLALPAPAHLPANEAELIAPTSEIEQRLVKLWRQILEVPALGIDDNFFHLGGESLRATRAVSQINAEFHCRLTLPRMFEAPTVRQMARVVETAQSEPPMPTIKSRIKPRSEQVTDVSRLSEQEVDNLLTQLLANDEASTK